MATDEELIQFCLLPHHVQDAHLSIRDTLAEVRPWVRLALTIPVTLGGAVANGDTRTFSSVPKGELQIFDVDHF